MKKLIVLVLIVITTGCTTKYTRSGATEADVDRDKEECTNEAYKFSGGLTGGGMVNAMDVGWRRGTLFNQCMKLRGYQAQR